MKKKLPVKVCDACEEPFEPEFNSQKRHQTKKCRNINERKLYKLCKKPPSMINCGSCGERFQPTTSRQKKHTTRDCKRIYERERMGWNPKKYIIICEVCGLPLKTTSNNQKIHSSKDGDCHKLYWERYRLERDFVVSGRHKVAGSLIENKIDNFRIFTANLTGDCKYRDCLKCGESFMSTSKSNRICFDCGTGNLNLRYDTNEVHLDTSTGGGGL